MKKLWSIKGPGWLRWIKQPRARCGWWQSGRRRAKRQLLQECLPALISLPPKTEPPQEPANKSDLRPLPARRQPSHVGSAQDQLLTTGIHLRRKREVTVTNMKKEVKTMARTAPETHKHPGPQSWTSEILSSLTLAGEVCLDLDLIAALQAGFIKGRRSLPIEWCEEAPFAPEIRRLPCVAVITVNQVNQTKEKR